MLFRVPFYDRLRLKGKFKISVFEMVIRRETGIQIYSVKRAHAYFPVENFQWKFSKISSGNFPLRSR
jgi:hypothetical protein